MKCPIDQTDLLMTDRQGIEIDYCPQCRGVWLDRGELDKLIDRTESAAVAPAPAPVPMPQAPPVRQHYDRSQSHDRHYDDYQHGHHKKRKKENFLGDLFDF
jgi:uncharacterized protein